jgi:hypothetical protein
MQAQICSASIEGSVRTFDAFLENASQLKADYQGQVFPTPVFTKGRVKILAALMLVLGLAYAGYVGFDIYQQKQRLAEQEAAERIRQNSLTAEEMERLAEARRIQVEAFQQRVQAARQSFEKANGAAGPELYTAWRRVITNMPASIIPYALKRDVQCKPDLCVGSWMVSGGKMLDRLGLEAAGARLSGGDSTVEAVVGASIIESEYALPIIEPRPMGDAEYPRTALAMVDDLKHMGEVHFPMPIQPVIVAGVPDMQIPDEVIGQRQAIVITTSGPFALQRIGDILEKSSGISVNWDLLRVEFESQYGIRQIQLQGNILFKPEN